MPTYQSPVHFTVSQIRVAATCPRIFYFDLQRARQNNAGAVQVTRIWEQASNDVVVSAAGSLFHGAVEKFNRLAATDGSVLNAVENDVDEASNGAALHEKLMKFFNLQCLNRQRLADKPPATIEAFVSCAKRYMQELTDIIVYARSLGRTAADVVSQLFADKRKVVDVTFYVGPDREPVHITGRLDYVFYDWRVSNHRIIDYKLTPSQHPANDLFQVVTYALMHHHQHQTEPDVGVFYLHPERKLVAHDWQHVYHSRHKIYDLLASMLQWQRYPDGDGFLPPAAPEYCERCPWKSDCEDQLGSKDRGERFVNWSRRAEESAAEEPNSDEPRVDEPSVEVQPVPDLSSLTAPSHGEPADDDAADRPRYEDAENSNGHIQEQPERTDHQTLPDSHLCLGDSQPAHTSVSIPKPVLSTHTAIVGAAGSGKTWLAKVFLEEAVLQGVPVLAIDPQGDLVQFLHQQPVENIPLEHRDRYQEFVETVEPRIYTPGSSHAIRLSLSPIRLPNEDDLQALPAARRREEFDAIVNTVSTQLVALTLKGKRSVEQQQTFLSQTLKKLIAADSGRALMLTDIVAAVHAPEDLGIDDVDMLIKKTDRENLGRQLYALAQGPLARLFTGGQSLDIDYLRTPVQSGRVPLNVIYLNALNEPEKHAFLASLATELYRWMSCSGGDPQSPQLLFYLDEARDFLPAGTSSPPAKRPVSRLFTQGRKFGVGCVVCTQSPRSVDYNIFGNCSTKIIGRLETPQDSDRVAEWFTTSGAKPAWVNERAGAEQSTFVGRWPDQPQALEGAVFRSRHLYSHHEGAWSPERVESEVAADSLHQRIRADQNFET